MVERQPILLQNAKKLHPDVLLCNDVRSSEWRQWNFEGRAEVLIGSPPYQPYSEAGPAHGSNHRDADQISILAEAAKHFGARWVNYENVPKLVQKFKAFFQQSVDFYRTLEFLLLDASVLRRGGIEKCGCVSRRCERLVRAGWYGVRINSGWSRR